MASGRGWRLVVLLLAVIATLAHAARPTQQQLKGLPPIITVKSLKTTTGPSYTFEVSSRLVRGLDAPLYPGQSATAKVAVDVTRAKAGQGYLVTGRVIVTNPMRNPEALDVTGLKAAWGPSIPLITPPPAALDCPGALLQAGESLSCSFRLELATSIIKTLTPVVLLRGLPQMQGEALPLDWPSAPQQPGSSAEDTTGCALVQNQVIAGDMQPIVRVSSSEEEAELMSAGIEVCSDAASFSYDVLVGPFDDKSSLCGPYQVTDLPTVRLASGSLGSSSVKPLLLPVTLSGCRQKGLLGGDKPTVAISKLTLARVTVHGWEAEAVASTNTSSPAKVKVDAQHPVDVAVQLTKTDKDTELALVGEVTVTNTDKLPAVLPQQGVRIVLSQEGEANKQFITADCPLVGSTIVVRPQLSDAGPGTVVCTFRVPVTGAWSKGLIQAQLQTLLSATHEVDSGLPQPYNFDDKASVTPMAQSECVSLSLARVTEQADLASANSDVAVTSLAQSLGGDNFKLLPAGVAVASGGRVPPAAADVTAAPYVVCESAKVAWRESYGPFSDLDCGPGMALSGFTAQPTSGPSPAASATLAFPIAVQGCSITPEIKLVNLHTKLQKVHDWRPSQKRTPAGDASVPYGQTKAFKYAVSYKRSTSLGGFRLSGLFKVFNKHAAELVLERVQYMITQPSGEPIMGEATCSASVSEAAAIAALNTKDAAAAPQQGVVWTDLASDADSASAAGSAAKAAAKKPKQVRVKLAAAPKSSGSVGVAAAAASQDDGASAATEYYEDGDGPLYCSFEADLPDDYAADVILMATTDQGATATKRVGTIDWDHAETQELNECAKVSFAFSDSKALMQPSKVEGTPPPALAVRICEPKTFTFTATFGSWVVTQCGPKRAEAVATVNQAGTDLVSDVNDLNLEVTGCPGPLPIVQVDATQASVKCVHEWTIKRRLAPVGKDTQGIEPASSVASAGKPTAEPAVLSLPSKYSPVPEPGHYSKFNQTIVLTKTTGVDTPNMFEVKGTVKLSNDAGKEVELNSVFVKISCEEKSHPPVLVNVVCPDKYYKTDEDSGEIILEVPVAATKDHPVKCSFGAVVPGPGAIVVDAVAVVAADGNKARAKRKVHLVLDADSTPQPQELGNCIRISELRIVRDSVTGSPVQSPLLQGKAIPEAGIEVCAATTFSFVARIGPLEARDGDCQAITYSSTVNAQALSGYEAPLQSEGVVETTTSKCSSHHDDDGSEALETYTGTHKGHYKKHGQAA